MVYCCDPKIERLKNKLFKNCNNHWMLYKSPFESLTILITIFLKIVINKTYNNVIDFKKKLQNIFFSLSITTCSLD